MVAQSEAFQKAVEDSKKLTAKPNNEELLDLYGMHLSKPTAASNGPPIHLYLMLTRNFFSTALYKIGLGEDVAKAPAPGMFDLKGKAKKNAWEKTAAEGYSPDIAQQRYVTLVESLKEKYGYDADKQPEAVGN
ncbi:hypothetical protein AK830_g10969 [Neonectria ditissima]|uniref:ACB domain-containing protein n=1 Tax=Neonectria ditissima TaxID=78410 RepID=A0A0P7ANK1_9HYPO|nr:hypothetical protein AK830_g10969 [Neonectria ditissima]